MTPLIAILIPHSAITHVYTEHIIDVVGTIMTTQPYLSTEYRHAWPGPSSGHTANIAPEVEREYRI